MLTLQFVYKDHDYHIHPHEHLSEYDYSVVAHVLNYEYEREYLSVDTIRFVAHDDVMMISMQRVLLLRMQRLLSELEVQLKYPLGLGRLKQILMLTSHLT